MSASYRRSVPATLLSIIKFVTGFASLALLFFEVEEVRKIIESMIKSAESTGLEVNSIEDVIGRIFYAFDPSGKTSEITRQIIISAKPVVIALVAIPVLFLVLGAILKVIDGIGALLLRFGGSSILTKIVHSIYAAKSLLGHVICIALAVLFAVNNRVIGDISEMPPEGLLTFKVVLIAFPLFFSVIPLAKFFYHKDIVQAAAAVTKDRDGEPDLVRNHLKLWAILASIYYFFNALVFLGSLNSESSSFTLFKDLAPEVKIPYESVSYLVWFGGIILLLEGVKYVLIVICNGQLKRSYEERYMKRRSMTIGERMIIFIPTLIVFALIVAVPVTSTKTIQTFAEDMTKRIDEVQQQLNDPVQDPLVTESTAEALVIPPAASDTEVRAEYKKMLDDSEELAKKYSEFIRSCQDPDNMTLTEMTAKAAYMLQFAEFVAKGKQWKEAGLTSAERIYLDEVYRRVDEKYPELKATLNPADFGVKKDMNVQ